MLIQEDVDRFEGLLKKIQNHREIVNTYEIKLEGKEGQIESSVEPVEPVPETIPTVIYQKGRRIILDVPVLAQEGKNPTKVVEKKFIDNENRRS